MKRILSRLIHSAAPEICMDVAALAAKRGWPLKQLHPPVINEIEPYVKGDYWAQEDFNRHHEFLERAQTLVTIEQATIRDVVGFVELPDGQICFEGNWWLPILQDHPAYKQRFSLKNRRLKGNIYSLLCSWASEFYHWFHDVLPRLETALMHLPQDIRFLIQSNPKTWQLDSLAAYGIGRERLEPQPHGMHTRVEKLWFATPIGHESLGSGAVLRRVANRLLRYFADDNLNAGLRNVYVSRRKATCRRVVNETEIEPVLKERGFETVLCEDLALAEQVKLFSNASAIVGPMGAGLTNLIYSSKGSFIGEIQTSDFPNAHYLVMSQQLGMRFDRFKADAIPLTENRVDMRVDPQFLSKCLSTCLDG